MAPFPLLSWTSSQEYWAASTLGVKVPTLLWGLPSKQKGLWPGFRSVTPFSVPEFYHYVGTFFSYTLFHN